MGVAVYGVCFLFSSLVMGTKEKGMSLPHQALAATGTVSTVWNT